MNKKDNPVPSIEDVYEWMERNKDYDKKSYGCKIHKQKTKMLESLFLMLNTIKQNGVETDNEQLLFTKDTKTKNFSTKCIKCGKKFYNLCPNCNI